jgi:hypothetical protein
VVKCSHVAANFAFLSVVGEELSLLSYFRFSAAETVALTIASPFSIFFA